MRLFYLCSAALVSVFGALFLGEQPSVIAETPCIANEEALGGMSIGTDRLDGLLRYL